MTKGQAAFLLVGLAILSLSATVSFGQYQIVNRDRGGGTTQGCAYVGNRATVWDGEVRGILGALEA